MNLHLTQTIILNLKSVTSKSKPRDKPNVSGLGVTGFGNDECKNLNRIGGESTEFTPDPSNYS